jgi:hypothetical protein
MGTITGTITQAEWEAGVRERRGWWTLSESKIETALRTARLTQSDRRILQVLAQQEDRISPAKLCGLMGWRDGRSGVPASAKVGRLGKKLFEALKKSVPKDEMPAHVIVSFIQVERNPGSGWRWDWFQLPLLTQAVRKVLGSSPTAAGPPATALARSPICRCLSCQTHGPLLVALGRLVPSPPALLSTGEERPPTAAARGDEEVLQIDLTQSSEARGGGLVPAGRQA